MQSRELSLEKLEKNPKGKIKMTDKSPNYITKAGFQKLQAEFQALFQQERPKLVETIAWAAGNGDRSENGDYIYGKKRLREIDKRLKFLRDRIESAIVVEPEKVVSDKVVFGATVYLINEDENPKHYQIVGEDEIAPNENKISWKSPIGNSLIGKKVGDEITVKIPSGETFFEIVKIEFK